MRDVSRVLILLASVTIIFSCDDGHQDPTQAGDESSTAGEQMMEGASAGKEAGEQMMTGASE